MISNLNVCCCVLKTKFYPHSLALYASAISSQILSLFLYNTHLAHAHAYALHYIIHAARAQTKIHKIGNKKRIYAADKLDKANLNYFLLIKLHINLFTINFLC